MGADGDRAARGPRLPARRRRPAGSRASRPAWPRSARRWAPPSSAGTSWRRRAGQRVRRPLGDRAGRPRRAAAGAALGGAARGRGGARGPARVGGVRPGRAPARLQQPDGRRRPRTAGRRRRTRPDRPPRTPGPPRCATSATGCWPTPGTSRRDSRRGRRPGPGGARARLPRAGRPAAAGRRPRSGADPLAWVLTGGEDHALVATFPADASAARGVDGDRRGAGRRARSPGCSWTGSRRRTWSRAVGRGGSGACPLRLRRLRDGAPVTLRRACPTTTRWRRTWSAGSSRSTSQRYGGPDEAVGRPRRVRAARGAVPRRRGRTACRPAAAPGGRYAAGRRRDQAGLRGAGVPPARAGAGDRGRAGGAAPPRPGTGPWCSTPATEQPEALALYADAGLPARARATGCTRARRDAVFLGKDLPRTPASGRGTEERSWAS